jgi:hypothetical protein
VRRMLYVIITIYSFIIYPQLFPIVIRSKLTQHHTTDIVASERIHVDI